LQSKRSAAITVVDGGTLRAMSVSFDVLEPWWLAVLAVLPWIILLPRGGLSGLDGPRLALATTLRCVAILALVLGLARARVLRVNDRLGVIFVVDRSDSVSGAERDRSVRRIRAALADRDVTRDDAVGLVVFARTAAVEETAKRKDLDLLGFSTVLRTDATDVQSGLRLAAASFPDDVGGRRIVLFSDGHETAGRAIDEVRAARAAGIVVDIATLDSHRDRDDLREITVLELRSPAEADPGAAYRLRAIIDATRETEVRLWLDEDGHDVEIGERVVRLRPGRNHVEFPSLRHESAGVRSYRLRLEPISPNDDTVSQNNVGRSAVVIGDASRVLLCTADAANESNLLAALRAEEIDVDVVSPGRLPVEAAGYLDYDVVIFSNVGAHRFSEATLDLVRNLVEGTGIGFVMIGGEESFGAGSYQGTAIERILPVDLDVRGKRKLPNSALAMVVHSCELDNGNYWARRIIQRTIELLAPPDWAGVLFYGNTGRDEWLFPMTRCEGNKPSMLARLARFEPGDMLSFETILSLAYTGLSQTRAAVKHIIILTDGDPTPPSDPLVAKIVDDGRMTISTICYGAHGNIVPVEMKLLAEHARGRFHFLTGPEQLPEIFVREVAAARKTLIREEPFVPVASERHDIIENLPIDGFPELGGLVITEAKPLARTILVHPGTADDPTRDPVLAAWTFGAGRVVAFTSDSGRRWGRKWSEWQGFGRFWSQAIRWTSGSENRDRFRVEHSIENGRLRIVADLLDNDGEFVDGADVRARLARAGEADGVVEVELRQTGPGRYESSELDADAAGTIAIRLEAKTAGETIGQTTAASVSYSPEFRSIGSNDEFLARLAELGGGRSYSPDDALDAFARDLEFRTTVDEIWLDLVLFAIALFFLDIFVRRVAIDPKSVVVAARGVFARLARRQAPADPGSEKQIEALLEAKMRARTSRARVETGDAARRSTHEVSSPAPVETGSDVPVFDARDSAARQPVTTEPGVQGETRARVPSEGRSPIDATSKGQPSVTETGAPPEGSTYTERLLRAKKRALRPEDDRGGDR
jgi:uncharacterized membrane protein